MDDPDDYADLLEVIDGFPLPLPSFDHWLASSRRYLHATDATMRGWQCPDDLLAD